MNENKCMYTWMNGQMNEWVPAISRWTLITDARRLLLFCLFCFVFPESAEDKHFLLVLCSELSLFKKYSVLKEEDLFKLKIYKMVQRQDGFLRHLLYWMKDVCQSFGRPAYMWTEHLKNQSRQPHYDTAWTQYQNSIWASFFLSTFYFLPSAQ